MRKSFSLPPSLVIGRNRPHRFWSTASRALVLALAAAACLPRTKADDWVEVRTPQFTILSEASASRTRAWAVEFELFRRAMTTVMPLDSAASEPVTVVLFRTDRRLRPFKPLENGKTSNMGGYFIRAPGRNFIAIAIEGARDDVRELIFHEAVHWHLAASSRTLPLWLEEGLAEVLGNFRLSGSSFVIGSLRPEFMHYVNVAGAMPFSKMAEMDRVGLGFTGKHADVTQLFYCESWLLVHSLLFGTDGIGCGTFARFITSEATDDDYVQDTERGLGVDFKTLDRRVADYLHHGRFNTLTRTFDRSAVEAQMQLRDAPAGEADLTLGNLLVGIGRASDASPYLDRARAALPNDIRVTEALALLQYEQDQLTNARQSYEQVLSRGKETYLAHYVIARAILMSALRDGGSLTEADDREATTHLLRQVELNPRSARGYDALATIAILSERPDERITAALSAGIRRFSASCRLRTGLGYAHLHQGNVAAAREQVEAAERLRAPNDDAAAAALRALRAQLHASVTPFTDGPPRPFALPSILAPTPSTPAERK